MFIDDLAQKIYAILPTGLQQFEQEIQQQIKQILQASLNKLNLVSREEFDAQVKVLERTREKVEALEARLNENLSEDPNRDH